MNPPNAGVTARERARAELTREIKEEASRQLAAAGADGLSLRAVARSLGMVSSALYRYFPSRDDLLTALIVDAYNAVGDAAEAAIASHPAGAARSRWTEVCRAVRAWAIANPHEYTLIYGSPVPGYRAPESTVGPASRTPLAFIRILRDAAAAGEMRVPDGGLPDPLACQAAALATALAAAPAAPEADTAPGAADFPPGALVRAVIAWTQLFGMISFELFGQFVGSFEPADALFEHAVAQLTAFVGL
jgi:AcrR family transcriptional regulator